MSVSATSDKIKEMLMGAKEEVDTPTINGAHVCPEVGCEKSFPKIQGLNLHALSHKQKQCKFCKKRMKASAIGPHQFMCHENPDREANMAQALSARNKTQGKTRPALRKAIEVKEVKKTPAPVKEEVAVVTPLPGTTLALTENDIETVLSMFFPQGIPVSKIDSAVSWIEATKALLV